jgi:RNA polymerase sigma-70 factor (ECF subfamily)
MARAAARSLWRKDGVALGMSARSESADGDISPHVYRAHRAGRSTRRPAQPGDLLAGVYGVMTALIETLFEAEYERLVRSLGVAFDAESAADAVQDAFIRADREWSTVGSLEDPAGWVRRVALNRLLNGRRDQARREEILATVRPVPDADLTAELLDLRRAVASLPNRMRAALCLHHLAGLPVREVAVALEVSEGTVKSNLHDARRRLRELLEEASDV